MLACLFPLLALLLLELALRGFGLGYPTGFFLQAREGGREVWIDNQAFTRRYFPPGLERTPQTISMAVPKPADTVRVFVFGESAALGDPEPAYGFPRVLEVMLRASLAGKRVEVINVALTAINSHVVRDIARDCVDKQGDYWIVYLGNNEVVGPFGAGTVFGQQVPGLPLIRANLAVKSTRVGQLMDALRWRLGRGTKSPAAWEGMEMFLHQQVESGDSRLARTYDNFQQNLRQILALGKKSGAQVVVATMAANLKDCPPFASRHRADLDPATLAAWQAAFDLGWARLQAGDFVSARQQLTNAVALDDRHAAAHYACALAELQLGQTNEARQSFEQARELDTLRFRSDARINQIIRDVAAAQPGVRLLDLAQEMAARSPQGLPGEEYFFEHVHFNFEGNYLVASLLAREVLGRPIAGPETAPARCAAALAYSQFDRYRVLDEVRQRLEKPPFSSQLGHADRAARIRKQLDALQPASFTAAKGVYEQAVASRPDDWILRENFGTLLKDFNQTEEALAHWKKMVELVPHSADACLGLADTLDAMGHPADAIVWFRRALLLRPEAVETRNGLGLALAGTGDMAGAIRELEKALRYQPSFAEARVNLGQILGKQGQIEEARRQYLEALRWNSNSVAAHINLGKLLAGEGKLAEAAAEYREAIRIKPESFVAHFNLGNALAGLNDSAGSLRHYAEAARLNPAFSDARYRLGLAFARTGKNSEALTEFAEVTRLDPDLVEGHLNFGVALAKAGRYDEAIAQFQETLRLQPSHAQARQFLEKARARRQE